MQTEALDPLRLQNAERLGNLRRRHAVLRVARVIHDAVREFEHAARIIAAAHGLRELSELFFHTRYVGNVVQVDDAAELRRECELAGRRVIRGEHNLLAGKPAGITHHELSLRRAVHAAAVLLQNL